MHLGAAFTIVCHGGRATNRARGLHRLPNPNKLRMLQLLLSSEGMGAKVHVREGKNPDHQLRSLNIYQVVLTWSDCFDSQDVGLEAAMHLKSAQQLTSRAFLRGKQSGIKLTTEAMALQFILQGVGEHSSVAEGVLRGMLEILEKQMQA
eukprot:TRINITY_DN224_c0_g1_i4.p3 TRINITY_DN224_c0_g1~~TRINITY_DN224_c0_g1_i4.p3  ORF type:complete len:149 (-),score=4.17 TRINITY_DN224_c0_g1_i4:257-703(-)